MRCPKCDSRCAVKETRESKVYIDEVYRKLICPQCGFTFHTVEFPVEESERFASVYKSSARAARSASPNGA